MLVGCHACMHAFSLLWNVEVMWPRVLSSFRLDGPAMMGRNLGLWAKINPFSLSCSSSICFVTAWEMQLGQHVRSTWRLPLPKEGSS